MNYPLTIQTKIQNFMSANGMIYAVVQISILIYAAIFLLPLLGPPGGTVFQRYEGYANNAFLFKVGNYLMGLPTPFFLLFLGGVYAFFNKIHESIRGILFTALLSGSALIMLWSFGAIISVIGVDIAAAGGDKITSGAFDSIVPYSLGLSALPRAVFLFSLSVLLYEHKWLSRIGFFIAALSLLGNMIIAAGMFLPFSLLSALLFQVWVFCCSFKMFRNQKQIQESSI
ncbi:MAG: hypothetical protein M3209_00820 [Acidobacteriota bacterium]|nr:hypothetical protein [Acidobacteriota bacterium]